MATLLSKTSLPLWVWIVIIVVGSAVVLGTIALLIRLVVSRRRQAEFIDTFGDDNLPQRKITVRRGRVVEQSKYLSLTGSRFGLNAFGPDGNDSTTRDNARSKSPFEWWANVKDRSLSRNSQMTQVTNDTSSMYGAPTSPTLHRMYQRRDLNVSTSSFGSTLKDNSSISVNEEPLRSPPLVRNFSRSFSRPGYNSAFSPRIQTLSRIEESSPHNSIISERASRIASYADGRGGTTSPLPGSPIATAQLHRQSTEQNNPSKKSSLQYESMNHASYVEPPSMVHNASLSSLGDVEAAPLHRSKRNSVTGSIKSQRQSHITALPEMSLPSESDTSIISKNDQHPIRASSKRGNVLRKKSLTRSALVVKVDS